MLRVKNLKFLPSPSPTSLTFLQPDPRFHRDHKVRGVHPVAVSWPDLEAEGPGARDRLHFRPQLFAVALNHSLVTLSLACLSDHLTPPLRRLIANASMVRDLLVTPDGAV